MSKNNLIVTAPNPILYKKTNEIKNFDTKLKQLTDFMISVMRKADGMGLAAPQIGKSLRIAVIEYKPKEDEKENLIPVPLTILVNPKIIKYSTTKKTSEEGCLSLPDINLDIARAEKVTVIHRDIEGARHRMNAEGLTARMVQHEVDHLDGILITDRVDKTLHKKYVVYDK